MLHPRIDRWTDRGRYLHFEYSVRRHCTQVLRKMEPSASCLTHTSATEILCRMAANGSLVRVAGSKYYYTRSHPPRIGVQAPNNQVPLPAVITMSRKCPLLPAPRTPHVGSGLCATLRRHRMAITKNRERRRISPCYTQAEASDPRAHMS